MSISKIITTICRPSRAALIFSCVIFCAGVSKAQDLYVGAATADITPPLPVALMGQFYLRVTSTIETPISASVLVLESRYKGRPSEAVVFVSCDLLSIPLELTRRVREHTKKLIPELDPNTIILSATHTHTAPVLESGFYNIAATGVTQVEACQLFTATRISNAIAEAWKKKKGGGSVTWGLGTAVVGYNRRAVYTGGTDTKMYGKTNLPEFRSLEGYEDHDVNSLFVWDKEKKLIAMSIEVPCPAQEVESRNAINADYWHPVRERLKARFGKDLCVLGWIGAAGDQSPHLMFREEADARMVRLANSTRIDQIAKRITRAVTETYELVKDDRYQNPVIAHKMSMLKLPMRKVTLAEYNESKELIQGYKAKIASNPAIEDELHGRIAWNSAVLDRYENQQRIPDPDYLSEIHVVRIGDIAVCTNQFELFLDYGIRIEARSKALQTFIIQLAGPGSYLPTEKAVEKRGYSAVCQSNLVGPEGGQILVNRTVEIIDELWEKK